MPKTRWDLPVHESEDRTGFLMEQCGQLRNLGCGVEAIYAHMSELNEDTGIIADPLDDNRLRQTAENCCKYEVPEREPRLVIGKTETPVSVDWRTHYHSLDEIENAPPAAFLIDGFLAQDVITALAAPVGQRKSIVALNLAYSLCTGDPLLDYFKVVQRPVRTLYLCPEMGIRNFADRVKRIGLLPCVGKTFFCRTMNAEGALHLDDLQTEEVQDAVVIVDTAIRYLEGDENSSEDMRRFAEQVFGVMRRGAVAMLVLHHSPKGTKDSSELTLENAMRGSGELGAFVGSVWATRLQVPDAPYASASYMTNVKQRDFESKPFEFISGPDYRLHIVKPPDISIKLAGRASGVQADADGMEEAAIQIIRANRTLSGEKLSEMLKAAGIRRGKTWCRDRKYDLMQEDAQAKKAA